MSKWTKKIVKRGKELRLAVTQDEDCQKDQFAAMGRHQGR